MRTPPDPISNIDLRSRKRVPIPISSLLSFVITEESLEETVPTMSLMHFASWLHEGYIRIFRSSSLPLTYSFKITNSTTEIGFKLLNVKYEIY
ncbi:hypothetical protein HanPI659440_Chr08g0280801 [Helianthus annuus]|nr:hypothetical protein HanPI659440_Chr08g0280801 [Helianthus annuus]